MFGSGVGNGETRRVARSNKVNSRAENALVLFRHFFSQFIALRQAHLRGKAAHLTGKQCDTLQTRQLITPYSGSWFHVT